MKDGLLPSAKTAGVARVQRVLPPTARNWGRVLDLEALDPGDLLLFRPVGPENDKIANEIVSSQREAGFADNDARWTHAAVYLGDGELVCEANIGLTDFRSGVILRSANYYCDGQHVIRARRPAGMTLKERMRIAIGAVRLYRYGYSFRQLWRFRQAARTGEGIWLGMDKGPRIPVQALVCSTLYQDAYTFAFEGNKIRTSVFCTPADLSSSDDFEDEEPTINWLDIPTEVSPPIAIASTA